MRRKWIAFGLAMMLALQPTVMFASDDESHLEELEEQKSEVESKESEADEKLSETQARVDEYITALEELDSQISEKETAIRELDAEIEENLALLEQTKQELEDARDNEAVWYQKLKLRMKAVYESGQINYLEILLQAGSMSDLFSKAEYTRDLAQYDQEILVNLGEAKEQVTAKEMEVTQQEAILEADRAKEEEQRQELQEVKDKKEKELKKLEEDKEALELYIQELEEQREELAGEIAETAARIEEARRKAEEEARRAAEEEARKQREAEEAERKRQEEERQQQQEEESEEEYQPEEEDSQYEEEDTGGDDDYEEEPYYEEPSGSVSLSWPLPGYYSLSCYYGNGHRGIDIPAPSGTAICASAGGTVITASYNGSYGNYVAIAHGNGYVTLYAHASALNCSAGDYVGAGQVIAYVGTTGYSTGNHLHFEVQIDGGLANPLSYVG
ncbi:MAG: peptidoglycan DD-metalloendopeptidase family protein [Clostridiales bacterium]|nr:peptidoglycan DD-metalloendopeptidase family protein [Clostridiales bacterium]